MRNHRRTDRRSKCDDRCDIHNSPYFVDVCSDSRGDRPPSDDLRDSPVELYTKDIGDGENGTIVFIHGIFNDADFWEYQQNILPELGFRTIAFDLRGYGRSDQPWRPYNFNVWADDLRAFLDRLGVECITLVGHSLGASIAMRYMARHGQAHVSRLVISASDIDVPSPFVDQILAGLAVDRPLTVTELIRAISAIPISDPLLEWYVDAGLSSSAWATRDSLIAIRDETVQNDLQCITVPTLVIHGALDPVTGIPRAMQLAADIGPNAQFILFENSGHFPNIQERSKWNSLVSAFASSNRIYLSDDGVSSMAHMTADFLCECLK